VVTVGSFDGVHRGHHAVLQRMASRAAEHDRATVLVTFDPHPLEVVNPSAAPMLITTPTERREALAATDLDYVVFLRFDEGLRTMPPERFVVDLLLGRWRMRELVIGEDHGFGRGRRGDVELLKRLGGEHGFAVEVVGPVIDREAGLVSSTRIRTAVSFRAPDGVVRLGCAPPIY
jgi:riboflavin kinase/FMN adenylyltransferase